MAAAKQKVYKYSDFVLVNDIEEDNQEYNTLKQIGGLHIQTNKVKVDSCTINIKISLDKVTNDKGYTYSKKEWTLDGVYDVCRHWFENFPKKRIIKLSSSSPLFHKKDLTVEQQNILYIPPPAVFIYKHNIEVENVLQIKIKTLELLLHYCFIEVKNHPLYSEYCDINVQIDPEVPETILTHQCELMICKGCKTNEDILKKHTLSTIVAILKPTPFIHYVQ